MHDYGALMNYTLTIQTTAGEVSGAITGTFTGAYPFGFVGYRQRGSCTLSDAELATFWDAVDAVLSQNSLTSANFVRTIGAVSAANEIIGETS